MRCRGAIGLLLATSGCSAVFGLDNPVLPAADAPDLDAPAGLTCVGVGTYQLCLPPGIADKLDYDQDTVLITDQPCPIVDASNPAWCIYAARHVKVTATLRATGSRLLVLVGTEDLTISVNGVVDVASHVAVSPGAGLGAGSTMGACGVPGAGIDGGMGGSGGAGGTYSTTGGDGGNSDKAGGVAAAVNPQNVLGTTLRGGCPGGLGGSGGNPSSPPGAGGGGVYLASKGVLAIDGKVNASGAGG